MWRPLALGLVFAVVAACSGPSHAPAARADAAPDLTEDAVVDAARGDEDARGDVAQSGADARSDADASRDATADALSAYCALATTAIVPDAPRIADVLSGASRNPSVSCASTPGSDAFYTLDVAVFTIVDLRVDALIDMAIAVRAGCSGDAVELGCAAAGSSSSTDGDPTSEPVQADASTDAAAVQRTSSLRVGLAPGRYTVIVDALAPDQPATAFTVSAATVARATNGTRSTTRTSSESSALGPTASRPRRFGTDGTLGVSMPVGAPTEVAGAATLARHATAIVSVAAGQIVFTTAIWP